MENVCRQGNNESVCQEENSEGTERSNVHLWEIFILFFKIGVMSFGGGLSAWIYREVVEEKGWLTASDLLSGIALGQVLPGINTANMAIYIGQRLRGIPGATAGLLGMISGPFFIIIGVAAVYLQITMFSWAHNFLCGVATAAVGLVLSVGIKSIRHTMRGIVHFSIMAIIVLTVGILRWPMVPVVLCLAPVSVVVALRSKGGIHAR